MNQAMATKDLLLVYLKGEKGNWVSGESLSSRMGVSRSAVWKHVRKLKEEGYLIESSPKKGYLLREASDMLLPNEVREGLDTILFGRKDIAHFEETDSTNARAKDLAARGAPEGSLVISETQGRGKGRRGRTWFSPPREGIYASLILRPAISPGKAPQITLLTAVAVAEVLLSLARLEVHIKWPNDIMVGGKKIAGILTEIAMEMDAVNYMVIGLGLNVNVALFPDDIREKATSVLLERGEPFSRVRLLREYLGRFEKYYEMFKTAGFEPILARWKELSNTMGRRIMVETAGDTFTGRAHDIDGEGVLILKDDLGGLHRIFSGDVTLMEGTG
jgi:BirA family biotin operon repressor/biotin-[acetyl-CoA-carboxylase] ligase